MTKQEKNPKELLKERTLDEAKREACLLLDNNWDDICRMRDQAAVNYAKAGKDGKFAFAVGIRLTQMPKGMEIDIKAKLACSVSLEEEYDYTTVDIEDDLGLDV